MTRSLRLSALAVLLALPPAARADSLKAVPADAAFYNSSRNNREQLQAVANSRAWARIWNLPAVQQLWQMGEAQVKEAEGPFGPVAQFLKEPANLDLIGVLGDAFGQDFFVYGGESSVGFLELMAEINGSNQFGRAFAAFSGGAGGDPSLTQTRTILQTLAANQKLLRAPDLVFGFELREPKRAAAQVDRLEKLLTALADQAPPLKGRVKRAKVLEGEFVTLSFDGSMVPWDEIPFDKIEEKPGEFKELVATLRKMKLTLALGVSGKHLFFSVGESTDYLAKFGGAGKKLADLPELKPLAKHADRKLTSVSYASAALLKATAMNAADLKDVADALKEAIPPDALTAKQRKQLDADLNELARDLGAAFTEPGAQVSFAFLTDRGQESFSYDYGKHPGVDSSKPLGLLNHVGGSPILASVSRSKGDLENYKLLVKWLKVGYRYADEFAADKIPEDKKADYRRATKTMIPLLQKLDEITTTMWFPAFDGEAGFVMDARWSSKQWHMMMPASDKPMPLPEFATVAGVKDAALLMKALSSYRSTLNEIITRVHELSNGEVPDTQIPAATEEKGKNGTFLSHPIPQEAGLDKQVVPTGGISDKVFALALSRTHAERLLASTPLKTDSKPLAKLDRPLASATYFDWAGFVDLLRPWVGMGAVMAAQQSGMSQQQAAEVVGQVHTVLEVLKVMRGYTSATYLEDGVLVTHSETVFKDLER